ncbi:MAG: GGDEF domain-containing phosphodiesterase [Pseudomonadota bacterium]
MSIQAINPNRDGADTADWSRHVVQAQPCDAGALNVSLYSIAAGRAHRALLIEILNDPLPVFVLLEGWSQDLAMALEGAGALHVFSEAQTDQVQPLIEQHLSGQRHVVTAGQPIVQRTPDQRLLRWCYDPQIDQVLVSPALKALMPAHDIAAVRGLDAFAFAIAGLAAGDVFAACDQAARTGGSVTLLHPAIQRPGTEGLGPYLSHTVRALPCETESKLIFGIVSNDVRYQDILALENRPGVLSEMAFRKTLSDFLSQAPKKAGFSAAVCIVSLDRFEQMNILLGRQVADGLLDQVAARLRERTLSFMSRRDAADERDIAICRIGGAQFAVAMEGALHISETRTLADYMLACFSEPFLMDEQRLRLDGRIGIAAAKATERSPDKIMSRAALALSTALKDPPGSFRVFDAQDAAAAQEKVMLGGELRDALDQDRLFIQYMPIIRLEDRTVAGFEALVRWDHPEMGLLTPALFIPMAEESGAITDVGDWVLSRALNDFAELCAHLPPDLYLAINISSEQLRRSNFENTVLQQLATSGLSENRLILELTESIVIEDFARSKNVMASLRARGIRWSIDDFGTGFSALSYLGELPFDELKIDKRFVRALSQNRDETVPETLINAILAIARSRQARIVAEGIETPQQARQLTVLGCDLGQGYHFAAPMLPEELLAFVSRFEEGASS